MLSIKKILFPTHFQEFSEQVFKYALKVAEAMDADLELLHVYSAHLEVKLPAVGQFQVQKEEEERAHKQMEAFVQKNVPAQFKGKINKHIVGGVIREVIIDFCNSDEDVDLIIMGIRGNYSLSKVIWSDRVAYILEKTQAPVLVVPEGGEFRLAKTIACTVMPDKEGVQIAEQVVSLARVFEAKVFLVALQSISTTVDLSNILDHTTYDNIEFEEIEAKAGIKGIHSFMEQHSVDLLVMHAPYRNRLAQLIRYSQAQKLALTTKIPMLVFKEKLLS